MPFMAAGAQFFCQREGCHPTSHLISVRAVLRAVRGPVKRVQQSSHMCEKLAFYRHFLRFVALIA
jgi:predicted LPLAT superfamily acyltransferase